MKKTNKKMTAKAILVKPTKQYTKDEVRSILGLSKSSNLSPSKYAGMGGHGKIAGSAVIAHLERVSSTKGRGRRSMVKVGRRYASGTVTVVAR